MNNVVFYNWRMNTQLIMNEQSVKNRVAYMLFRNGILPISASLICRFVYSCHNPTLRSPVTLYIYIYVVCNVRSLERTTRMWWTIWNFYLWKLLCIYLYLFTYIYLRISILFMYLYIFSHSVELECLLSCINGVFQLSFNSSFSMHEKNRCSLSSWSRFAMVFFTSFIYFFEFISKTTILTFILNSMILCGHLNGRLIRV